MRAPTAAAPLLAAALIAIPCSARAQDQARSVSQQSPNTTLHGRVLDATTGRGLEGAELTIIAHSDTLHARTGGSGEWQLAIDASEPYTVRARMLGYAPREL